MAGNKRNTRTTHPRKSARRVQALLRLAASPRAESYHGLYEVMALNDRIHKPPRRWLSADEIKRSMSA